jgi:hypothetical protein
MPSTVYSTQLLAVKASTVDATYTVPEGFRLVLRDIDGEIEGQIDSAGSLTLLGALGQQLAYWPCPEGPNVYLSWRGRQVFNPGQTFSLLISGDTAFDAQASGYLLTLP